MSEPHVLDTSGLLCPLPVIRTQDAVAKLEPGQRLAVWATDPGTMHDIPAWTRVHGHKIVAAERREDDYYFEIEVV
jgi:tRNA 2-thiouridine synthesizing protein A